jgi:hypothetical protein
MTIVPSVDGLTTVIEEHKVIDDNGFMVFVGTKHDCELYIAGDIA